MASQVVLECSAEPAPAAKGISMASKLQQLKLRQQEAKRSLKAKLSSSLGKEPVQCPVELSAASLPIYGAFPRLQDQGRVSSLPLLAELADASLIGTEVDPLTRPGTGSSVTSTVSSNMAYSIQGGSRPPTSYSTVSSYDSNSRPTTGARTGRSCDLASAASAMSLDSMGSCEDMGKVVLRPCVDPAAVLATVLKTLGVCNVAKRLELDWQANNEAILDSRRLVAHHSSTVQSSLHALILAVLPSVDALRSSTAKDAISLFQEMIQSPALVKPLDQEVEHIVPVVLKKAGEMSQAGRETFLAAEASALLSSMADCLSVARVAAAVMLCTGHKSPSVRTKAAMHLDGCVQGGNGQRLAGQSGMVARALKAALELAGEGQQDTRTYAKRSIFTLAALANALELEGADRLLSRMPEAQRKLGRETLDKLSSLPPVPTKRMPGRR